MATGTMANINPLRYRGYFYDTETGFYYLQSRYYDPVNHRFINADSYASTDSTDAISCNMFAYCGNNPVMLQDATGRFWITALIVTAVVAVCATTLSGCTSEETQQWPDDCPYQYEAGSRNNIQNNCYSYVFQYGTVRDPGDMSDMNIYSYEAPDIISLSGLRDAVLGDAYLSGKNVQLVPETWIDDYKSDYSSGSYLIAAKLSADRTNYHFALRLANGVWIDKPGKTSTRYGVIDGFADVWEIGNYTYDSDTLYFLYTP